MEVNIGSGKVYFSVVKDHFLLGDNGFCFGESHFWLGGKVNLGLGETDFAWAILILRVVIPFGKRPFVLGENGFWSGGMQIFGWANGGFDFANDNSYRR